MLCPIKAEPSRAQQNWAELSRDCTLLCSAAGHWLRCRSACRRAACEVAALVSKCCLQMWNVRMCDGAAHNALHNSQLKLITFANIRKNTRTHLHLRMPLTCVSQSVESHRAQRKCIWQIQREKCSLRAALEARTRAFRLKAFRVELFFVIYLYINNILWTAALPQTAEKASNSNSNINNKVGSDNFALY